MNPDVAYTFQSWQIFRTDDLDKLTDGSWVESPELINDLSKIQSLGPSDWIPPKANASGGVFKFTILTTEPVTIVPCCDTQPRITRTEPRNSPTGQPYSRASDIVLYFNGALNANTVRFANDENDDGIWITAKSIDELGTVTITNNDDKEWYSKPDYASVGGFYTVTMNSSTILPPEKSLMTVTVKGITNAEGKSMEEYSFSWNTSPEVNVELNWYEATYDNANDNITILWRQSGASNIVISSQLNRGSKITQEDITLGNNNNINISGKTTITGVNKINDSGVRGGMSVSGIEEYTIFIELYVQGIMESRTTFKIWNIPGMSTKYGIENPQPPNVLTDDRIIPISTAVELKAMLLDDSKVKYGLANDIDIEGIWPPIGNSSAPFKGKFYGNGHKITFTSGSSIIGGVTYQGLFGYTDGALIRDLTFEYNGSVINVIKDSSNSSEKNYFGGIAGYLKDTTVCNVITFGVLNITGQAGVGIICLGGITGYIEGSGKIENCRAALSTLYTSSGHSGEIRIGAVAGETGDGSEANNLYIENVYNSGGSTLNSVTFTKLLINGVTVAANVSVSKGEYVGVINIGGSVGYSGLNTMNDIIFTDGTVSFSGDNEGNYIYCGGIIGYFGQTNLLKSSFSGNVKGLGDVKGYQILIGGLVGYMFSPNSDDSGENFIHGCYVMRTKIEIIKELNEYVPIVIGGVLGVLSINSQQRKIIITDCFFEGGEINAKSFSVSVGGFCGKFSADGGEKGEYYVNNCGIFSGTINVESGAIPRLTFNGNTIDPQVRAGGFTCEFKGDISNCFSRINIFVKGSRFQTVGGFIATFSDGIISNCYVAGTVNSVIEGDFVIYVGGLVGYITNGTIKNSYATVNVLVNKENGESDTMNNGTYVGGLVGGGNTGIITNCFSVGKIETYSAIGIVCSGGIIGRNWSTISNTAALGESVIVGSSSTTNIGRIYWYAINNIGVNNYALDTMLVGMGVYNTTVTGNIVLDSDPKLGLEKGHGKSTPITTFISAAWWRTTLQFDPEIWDFSTPATYRGYPLLKGLAGQQ